jgi:hypothetical protein
VSKETEAIRNFLRGWSQPHPGNSQLATALACAMVDTLLRLPDDDLQTIADKGALAGPRLPAYDPALGDDVPTPGAFRVDVDVRGVHVPNTAVRGCYDPDAMREVAKTLLAAADHAEHYRIRGPFSFAVYPPACEFDLLAGRPIR